MKFLGSIAVIFVVGFLLGNFTPWWSVVPLAFVVSGVLNRNLFLAFLASFIGVLLLWSGYAFILDGGGVLSSKLAKLFAMPAVLSIGNAMILLSGIVAALPSAIAGMAGKFFFDLFLMKRVEPAVEEVSPISEPES